MNPGADSSGGSAGGGSTADIPSKKSSKKVFNYEIRRDESGRGVVLISSLDGSVNFKSVKDSLNESDVGSFKLVRGDGRTIIEVTGGLPSFDSFEVSSKNGPHSIIVELNNGETKNFNL